MFPSCCGNTGRILHGNGCFTQVSKSWPMGLLFLFVHACYKFSLSEVLLMKHVLKRFLCILLRTIFPCITAYFKCVPFYTPQTVFVGEYCFYVVRPCVCPSICYVSVLFLMVGGVI